MTRTSRTSKLAPLSCAALAIVALLVLSAPASAHHGGDFSDHGPAGTIASFDSASGQLTIDLAEGGSISGTVTRLTWIEAGGDDHGCDRVHHRRGERRQVHGDWCGRQLHGFGHHGGWGHGSRGGVEDLVPGATVEDALLVLKDGKAFYAKVELED